MTHLCIRGTLLPDMQTVEGPILDDDNELGDCVDAWSRAMVNVAPQFSFAGWQLQYTTNDVAIEWLLDQLNKQMTEENHPRCLAIALMAESLDAEKDQVAKLMYMFDNSYTVGEIEETDLDDMSCLTDDNGSIYEAIAKDRFWDECPEQFESYVDWDQMGRDYCDDYTIYNVKGHEFAVAQF